MKKLILAAVAILALGMATSALAGTAATQMNVTLTVTGSCTITTGTLDFGNHARLGAIPADATTNVTVNCTNGAPYVVYMDAGQNAAGGDRQMISGLGDLVAYAIYDDVTDNLWGDVGYGDTIPGDPVTGIGDGSDQNLPVRGSILTWVAADQGTFTDLVNVSVDY